MIHLVVALPCEARPLRDHFRLRPATQHPFRLYEGEAMRLVICGVGRINAATATAWLAGRSDQETAAWLNVGTAGHTLLPLGHGLLAHKVIDAASGASWYPGLAFPAPVPTETVLTVARPEREYRHAAVYEMEAAGFCAAAGRFAPWELIQCYKVISDNRQRPVHQVDERLAGELLTENLAAIASVADQLQALSAELAAGHPLLDWMLARWRFSQTQQARLHRLLQRHRALGLDPQALQARLRYCTTARAVLDHLTAEVEDAAREGLTP